MGKKTTLDDFFEKKEEPASSEKKPEEKKKDEDSYRLTMDMLRQIDQEDVKDILASIEKYNLNREFLFFDREDRVKFQDRSTYLGETRRIDWYGNMHKTPYVGKKGPHVKFMVAYLGKLTDEQKKLLHAEYCYNIKADRQYYILRGRVYLSGLKMDDIDKKKEYVYVEDFTKHNKKTYNQLVKNYNAKNEKYYD